MKKENTFLVQLREQKIFFKIKVVAPIVQISVYLNV